MPKELIWGDTVTVRRGDLPLLQARCRADVAFLLDAATDNDVAPTGDRNVDALVACHLEVVRERDELRRNAAELELLRNFVTWLGPHLASPAGGPTSAGYPTGGAALEGLIRRYARLGDALAAARAAASSDTAEPPPLDPDDATAAPTANDVPAVDATDEVDEVDEVEEVTLQLFMQLTWERGAEFVNVVTRGYDHATATEVDLGGHFLTLSWASLNKAIKKFRVARDQSWGAPE